MQRFFSLLILLVLSAIACYSQKAGYLSLSIGPSFPIGQFGNKDASDPKSGLADIGGMADLSYVYKIRHSNYGLVASIRVRENRFNSSAFLDPFEKEFPDFDWSQSQIKKSWKVGAVMIGGSYSFPITKRVNLEGQLMAGIAKAYLPDIVVMGFRDTAAIPGHGDFIHAETKKVNATTFSASIKIGASCKLTDRWSLVANVDYWYLRPTFKNLTQTLAQANNLIISGLYSLSNASSISYYQYTRNYPQDMSTLNITVGLSMRL
ncbi:hypothetical protein ACX0G9_12060 [Flavitalea flava]